MVKSMGRKDIITKEYMEDTEVLDCLSKLEYRGYDSVGLAVRDGENKTRIVKAKGSLKESARSMRIWL